ncbi:MAG: AEC family transporter, partial [Clostridia bacterium]
STAKYVGNMVTPLSMFFIGATLYRMHCDGFHWEKGYGWVLAGRFVLAPAILLGSSTLLGLSPLMRDAFFLQAAMPSQTQNAIVADTSGADTAYATGAIALSTLCSLFFIPLYAIFLQMLG